MVELVSKRYVKALMDVSTKIELKRHSEYLRVFSEAFKDKSIASILLSSEINEIKKAELLIASLKDADKKFVNFIKILAQKKRIYLIPQIYKELQNQLNFMENRFEGVVFLETKISNKEIKEIEKILSKKVGSNIILKPAEQRFDGIKVEVEALGIEISFSKSKIKSQIIQHILKAI